MDYDKHQNTRILELLAMGAFVMVVQTVLPTKLLPIRNRIFEKHRDLKEIVATSATKESAKVLAECIGPLGIQNTIQQGMKLEFQCR